MMRKTLSLLLMACIVIVSGCSHKVQVKSNLSLYERKSALTELVCGLDLSKNQRISVRKIAWSEECVCGLIDVSILQQGLYYPYFITKEGELLKVIEFGIDSGEVDEAMVESVEGKFRDEHSEYFSVQELEIIGKRLDLDVVKIRHGMGGNMFVGNADALDPLYLTELSNKYLFHCENN